MNKQIISFSILFFLISIFFFQCASPTEKSETNAEQNPPAQGFDLDGSDQRAILIADKVMDAMGGRHNWDNTRFIKWNFFGKRELVWDKWSGDVRLEYPDIEATILININDQSAQVAKGGNTLEHPDSLSKYYEMGKTIWINDSYWLFMPFKLKDSGVTLKYVGKDSTQAGVFSDVLQLTFKNVGKSPDHKYHVYVDPSSNLITEWAFFNSFEDKTPVFKTPWENYSFHGKILLSDTRGENRFLKDVHVYESLPESVFLSLKDVDWSKIGK